MKQFDEIPPLQRHVILALVTFTFALFAYLRSSDSLTAWSYRAAWFAILVAIIHAMNLAYLAHIRKDIRSCVSITDVGRTLALDEKSATKLAAEQGIEPRYTVGGTPLYRLKDFEDAVRLLRPAEGPVELLRAARGAEQPKDFLLRPLEVMNDLK